MADREGLYALIESLPEGAVDSALQCLTALQTWPPKKPEYPADVQKTIKALEEKRDKFLKYGSGGWSIDQNNKVIMQFGEAEHNWQTGEYAVRTFRVHRDFPLEITEKFRMKDEDQTLEYEFHVSGLGKEHGFVLQFNANNGER